MSHIPSHHRGADESHNTFLVIFKIHGDTIQLWPKDKNSLLKKKHSFRISCHNVDIHTDQPDSDIKVLVIADPALETEKCAFDYQQPSGQTINSSELVIFMTGLVVESRNASYAIDLGVIKSEESNNDLNEDVSEKIGTAYLYIDPNFSTQGVQRTPIIARQNHLPVGQIQIEYLIVTNPIAYGQNVPRPEWLFKQKQLHAGHRGSGSGRRLDLPDQLLENTIDSFNYAHRHGADMVELDVMCTADGIPVVYHDYTLHTNQLGKTQIDEHTLEELRSLKDISVHDENCKHGPDIPKEANQNGSDKPFPTLEEVLRDVDQSCGLNIELKWPQLLPSGKNEATHYREINDNVDRILNCIHEHSNNRAIVLSTLNANIAIMMRLKQSEYPVLFLTTGDCQRFHDPTTKSVLNAIHFAQAFDMSGINPNAAYLTENLVKYAQDRGLLVHAWGKIESAQAIKELKRTGINGVIYDKIDLIKPLD